METIEIKAFKRELIVLLDEARNKGKTIGNVPVAQAYINAKISVLETLLIFINNTEKRGSVDMRELKDSLTVGETIALDELMKNRRGGILEPKLIEEASKLQPGQARLVNAEVMLYGHFSTLVGEMRKNGKLPEDVKPWKRGEKFYLVRLTPELLAMEKAKVRKGRKKSIS